MLLKELHEGDSNTNRPSAGRSRKLFFRYSQMVLNRLFFKLPTYIFNCLSMTFLEKWVNCAPATYLRCGSCFSYSLSLNAEP